MNTNKNVETKKILQKTMEIFKPEITLITHIKLATKEQVKKLLIN